MYLADHPWEFGSHDSVHEDGQRYTLRACWLCEGLKFWHYFFKLTIDGIRWKWYWNCFSHMVVRQYSIDLWSWRFQDLWQKGDLLLWRWEALIQSWCTGRFMRLASHFRGAISVCPSPLNDESCIHRSSKWIRTTEIFHSSSFHSLHNRRFLLSTGQILASF